MGDYMWTHTVVGRSGPTENAWGLHPNVAPFAAVVTAGVPSLGSWLFWLRGPSLLIVQSVKSPLLAWLFARSHSTGATEVSVVDSKRSLLPLWSMRSDTINFSWVSSIEARFGLRSNSCVRASTHSVLNYSHCIFFNVKSQSNLYLTWKKFTKTRKHIKHLSNSKPYLNLNLYPN